MLLPPLCTQSDYVDFAKQVQLQILSEPFDISKEVSKTWYVTNQVACDGVDCAHEIIALGTSHGLSFSRLPYGPLLPLKAVTAWLSYKPFVQ